MDRPTRDQLLDALRHVVDPELHGDVVELGMIRDVAVDDAGLATVELALTIAGCPMRTYLRDETEAKLGMVPGVTAVRVKLSEMTPAERSALMARARRKAADRAPDTEVPTTTRVLAIASGKGGVGKSSITANLATALAARGLTVGVLDADIWGFSVPRMLGVRGRLGGAGGKIHPLEQRVAAGRLSGETGGPSGPLSGDNSGASGPLSGEKSGLLKVVSMGHLVEDEQQALMWRGLILTKALEQFLTDVRWGDMDYLLVDMPPGTGDIQMGLARLLPRAEMIIVTTPAVSAQKVAVRAADMAKRGYLRVLGVIENMSAFTCDHGETYALFGEGGGAALAESVGAPLLGQVPIEHAVALGSDTGRPAALGDGAAAAVFRAIAERLVDELAPPLEVEGCTARMLHAVSEALDTAPTGAGA